MASSWLESEALLQSTSNPRPGAAGEFHDGADGHLVVVADSGTDKHYAGKDVKFGDKDRPVFWYKPKGKNHYRVIYGDLQVKIADKAPEKSKPE